MKHKTTRRTFIRKAAQGMGGLMILPSARTALGSQANEQLRLAVVGMAGYGAYHGFAKALHHYDNVGYAISCDVDLRKVQRVYDLWEEQAAEFSASDDPKLKEAAGFYASLVREKPPLYVDYRKMLDEAADRIDAVVVATPDHSHAPIAAATLRAGKPVFSEKPLTTRPHEARVLTQLARETKLPTQMNNHGTSSPGFRRGVEVIREGLIGEVRQVYIFFSRGGRNYQSPPQGSQPVPSELSWNYWLAQLQWRDYHPEWINRIGWRDTCIGELGNFGPHSANMAFMSLGVGELWQDGGASGKIRITAACNEANQLSFPRWERIRWEIPARTGLPPVTFTWHHGYPPDYSPGMRARLEELLRDHGATDEELKQLLGYAGCMILGDKGLLITGSHNTQCDLFPRKKFEDVEQSRPQTFPFSPGHYREWIDACRGGPAPYSNFEYAAPFAEFLSAGSISTRFPGETLEFDPATGQITNHRQAAEFISYPYREGWTI